ncbi:MAG: PAS domain S-box protein [Deltaproteobacteria bacterium]
MNRKLNHKHSTKKVRNLSSSPRQYHLSDWVKRRDGEKFQLLVENSPFGVSIIDPHGRYKYVNRKFRDMFGYSLKDVPDGRQWFQKAYPDERLRNEALSAWTEDLRKNQESEGSSRVFEVTCKDGTKNR